MMQRILSTIALALLGASCAGTAAGPAAPLLPLEADSVLHEILSSLPLDTAAARRLQEYELDHGRMFLDDVALLAEDPGASVAARLNALDLLGERVAATHVASIGVAAADRDPRVRAAAVGAAGRLLGDAGINGRGVVVGALDDPSPEVQAKALEVLDTREPSVLRDFLGRHREGSGADIARGLLHAAEQRGAPLATDSTGALYRQTVGGVTLEFRPARQWPHWQAAVGTVTVSSPASPVVRIEDVEVVAGVVPVFFSPEETAIVYEQGRRVYVRELGSGTVRDMGPGIAPRPLPFTEDFVFLRPDSARSSEQPDRTQLGYDVLQATFTGDSRAPLLLGQLTATAEMTRHGNYSPARWLQVVGHSARFALEGAGSRRFELPSPFGAGS